LKIIISKLNSIFAYFAVGLLLVSCARARAIDIRENLFHTDQSRAPIIFTQNHGQWDDSLLFKSESPDAVIWFVSNGIYYHFMRISDPSESARPSQGFPEKRKNSLFEGAIESRVIRVSFIGTNAHPNISGFELLDYRSNYFLGNNPAKWRTDVPNFRTIQYRNIYDGIDLRYYGNKGQLEYDFIVSPGANLSQINIRYDGVDGISIDNHGRLSIETKWGTIFESAPVLYQPGNDEPIIIEGNYRINPDNSFGFAIISKNYDQNLPLIIDPAISYSTYLGGGSVDAGNGIAVDSDGNAYIVGRTSSNDFPAVNQYQSYQASYDAFITKFSADGSTPIYSTYLGGGSYDEAFDIAVNIDGNAYITGYTRSINYPVLNEYQTDQAGADVFVTKLNSTGNGLIYSTYLGGDADDIGQAIAVNSENYAFLTGTTISSDFPTLNPYQLNQPYYDLFVTGINATGNGLIFSTYFGGDQDDTGFDICLDSEGGIYITGETFSSDFPILNQYQSDQLLKDIILVKLNSDGSAPEYSTYLGGNGDDFGYSIAVDSDKNAYITGGTASTDFPVLNPYQTDQAGDDVFVTKFNALGDGPVYSTYLGGSGNDVANSIALDNYGAAYIAGKTSDGSFPVSGSLQSYMAGLDAFATKINADGNGLDFGTFLGGSADEIAWAVALDAEANAYITGYTFSTNYTTLNPYQTDLVGADAFVTKIIIGAFICGDVNKDENINILDIVFLINYKYKAGPAPNPEAAADVNGDDNINILDIVYLINYKYKSGPPPDCS